MSPSIVSFMSAITCNEPSISVIGQLKLIPLGGAFHFYQRRLYLKELAYVHNYIESESFVYGVNCMLPLVVLHILYSVGYEIIIPICAQNSILS